MDVKITKKNGEIFSLEDHDVIVKDFIVSSIPLRTDYEEIEGKNGTEDRGGTYGTRTITVPFTIESYDLADYPLLRDELFGLVVDIESYFIQEMRRPKTLSYEFVDTNEPARMNVDSYNKLADAKRYLVRLQNSFALEQMITNGDGELIFETTELPFAESIFTSVDIEDNGLNYNDDLYAYGMGLSYDDDKAVYSGTITPSKPLCIFNPGNKEIEPFEMPIKITIKNVIGGSNGFKLKNITNETSITYNGDLSNVDVVEYNSAIITKNDLQATNEADLDYIELATGWNEITLERGQSVHFAVDTRFYYK